METDPNLETHTESRPETGEERTKTREAPTSPLSLTECPAAHTPATLTPTPPKTSSSCLRTLTPTPPKTSSSCPATPTPTPHIQSSSCPSQLSATPSTILSLTHAFTSCSPSTPTPSPPKLTPTPSSPSLTCKTLPYVSPALLAHAFTNPPSASDDPVATATLTPTHPLHVHSLPVPSHTPPPPSPTKKPAPLASNPPTLGPSPPLLTCPTVSAVTSLPSSSPANSNVSSPSGASPFLLANGNARTAPTPASPPITPFHTPASRQVHRTLYKPSLPQANRSTSPVRQRVSQQALLLGRSPCSSRDQMLLRAQMLQSLTLRPSDPATLTIPPSLRLKPPSSSLISRPRTPIFPPLRPRPQSSSMETDRQTTPTRHHSVPPPTLYPSVRSVPLRPRLHSPNGHRAVPPRHSPTLRQITSAPDHLVLPGRHWTGPVSNLSSQNPSKQSTPGQSLSPCSKPLPLGSTSCFDRLPPASRQLQMIALSAGSTSHLSSQPRPAANTHTLPAHTQRVDSVQSTRFVFENSPTHLNALQQRTSDQISPTSSVHIANSPLHSLYDPQAELEKEGVREERTGEGVEKQVTGEEEGTGRGEEKQSEMTGIEVKGERGMKKEEKQRKRIGVEEEQGEKEAVKGDVEGTTVSPASLLDPRPCADPATQNHASLDTLHNSSTQMYTPLSSEPPMDLQTPADIPLEPSSEPPMDLQTPSDIPLESFSEPPMDLQTQSDFPLESPSEPPMELQTSSDIPLEPPSEPPMDLQTQSDIRLEPRSELPMDLQTSSDNRLEPPSELPMDLQTPSNIPFEPPSEPPYLDSQEICENMSTQSDNQSVLSSLSSQSSPTSPFFTPPSDLPPPLLPVSPSQPGTLSVSHSRPDNLSLSQREPWKQRAWPEGERRVLTHLVEGFVIREGLQAFPMTRSSLLLGEQKGVSQNINSEEAGTLPFTDTPEPPEHSSESEQERTSTDDPLTAPKERQKGMLQCESCGKRGHAHSFQRSKRYCSTSCARRYNVGLSKRLRALSAGSRPEGRSPETNKVESVPGKPLLLRLPREIWSARRHDYEEAGERAVPMTTRLERRAARRARRASEPVMTPASPPVTPADPTLAQWSVEQVWDFIHTLPGCREVAEAFRVQEIDGQALLLLTEDHLMTSMNIKLGPALKICAHINALRHR
ncbi:cell surface glycoprotein 1-like isoform X2 [Esox lucius]|nr:cell surface glycoprotein 1-like isoform X2 [Esox lucius]